MAETLQDPAEITGIEAQFSRDVGGGQVLPMGEFVHHARLGQREAAVVQAFAQRADGACVEAAEPPDGGDAVGEGVWLGHHVTGSYIMLTQSTIFALV